MSIIRRRALPAPSARVPLSNRNIEHLITACRDEQQKARTVGNDLRELHWEDQMNGWLDVLVVRGYVK